MHSLIRRHNTDFSVMKKTSRHSDESYDSQESQSTAPSSVDSPRPSLPHAFTAGPKMERQQPYIPTAQITELCPRDSLDTYASTLASMDEQQLFDEPLEYNLPEPHRDFISTSVRPSSPQDFADYFPSTRRLFIHHDDTTSDGNMNLRVDTDVSTPEYSKETIQLFHMRMHDLKSREFSLRRYSRDSGREVCHTSRRYTKPVSMQRPSLQRSVSNALASFRGKPEFKRTNSGMSNRSIPKRQDSGYESAEDDEDSDDVESFLSDEKSPSTSLPLPTNTTKLEFSNYAQIDVRRRGTKNNKHYDFEYWGNMYSWRRTTEKHSISPSYHLVRGDNGPVIAHIVPELLSPRQMAQENEEGGWIPPCIMWISDKSVLSELTDVAEVVVSTGLIALIDDCIKVRWHTPKRHLNLPLTPHIDMEFVSPRAMIEQVFKRRNSGGSHKSQTVRSPLRYGSLVEN